MQTGVETWIDLGSQICKGFRIDAEVVDPDTNDLTVEVTNSDVVFDGDFRDPCGDVLFEVWNNVIGGYDEPASTVRYATTDGWLVAYNGEPLITVYFRDETARGEKLRLAVIEADFFGDDGRIIVRATREQFNVVEAERVRFKNVRERVD